MSWFFLVCLLFASLCSSSNSKELFTDILGQVAKNGIIKDYDQLSCNLKVVLDDGTNTIESFVTKKGTFAL